MSEQNALSKSVSNVPTKRPLSPFEQILAGFSGGVGALVPVPAAKRILRLFAVEASLNPQLQECTPVSIMRAVFTCAQLGLDPGALKGEVYLIPRQNNRIRTPDGKPAMEINVQIGYRGYIQLARRSGEIAILDAHVVYEGEAYEIAYGMEPRLVHIPAENIKREDDKIIAAYAMVRLKDGSAYFEWLWRSQIEARRKRSSASGNGPWVTDFAAMARKTAIRALVVSGRVPMADQFGLAAAADDEAGENARAAAMATMAQTVRESGEDPAKIVGEIVDAREEPKDE